MPAVWPVLHSIGKCFYVKTFIFTDVQLLFLSLFLPHAVIDSCYQLKILIKSLFMSWHRSRLKDFYYFYKDIWACTRNKRPYEFSLCGTSNAHEQSPIWVAAMRFLPEASSVSLLKSANSKGSGETALMHRLAWAFAGITYMISTICSCADSLQTRLYYKHNKKQTTCTTRKSCHDKNLRDILMTGFLSRQMIHYENMPIHWKFNHQKMKIFRKKNSDIFHISAQNIDCGYSLEPPRFSGQGHIEVLNLQLIRNVRKRTFWHVR